MVHANKITMVVFTPGCRLHLLLQICATNAIGKWQIREPVVSWAPAMSEKRGCKSFIQHFGLPVTVWQFTSSMPSLPIFKHDTQVSNSVEAITDMFFGVKMPAISDSTPKKPVITVKPSVSDLWRLCKCSFKKKHLWWTFRTSVNSPKFCTLTTWARKIFYINCCLA